MSGAHILPSRDPDFNDYLHALIIYLFGTDDITFDIATRPTEPQAHLRITNGDMVSFWAFYLAWVSIWNSYSGSNTRTATITESKNNQRASIESFIRTLIGDLPKSALTEDDRGAFNLKAHDTTPTAVAQMKIAPVLNFEPSTHIVQVLRISNPEDPKTQAMPAGQKVQLERATGTKGLDPATISFGNAELVNRFIHTITYTEDDSGKWAYYRCCYINTRGEKGPWSAVLSGVIM